MPVGDVEVSVVPLIQRSDFQKSLDAVSKDLKIQIQVEGGDEATKTVNKTTSALSGLRRVLKAGASDLRDASSLFHGVALAVGTLGFRLLSGKGAYAAIGQAAFQSRSHLLQFGATVALTGTALGKLSRLTSGSGGVLGFIGSKAGLLAAPFSTAGAAAVTLGAAIVGVTAAYKLLKGPVLAASNLNETLNATKTLFNEGAREVTKFSASAAKNLGQSQNEALRFAQSFASIGRAAGFTGTELAKFATKFAKISGDAGSFFNAQSAEVAQAISAALRGENDPIERFGVLINEATVKGTAYRTGLAKIGQELTLQQKIQARSIVIQEGLAVATGDFSRTLGESLPNQMKVFRAEIANVSSDIGSVFLPAVSAIGGKLIGLVSIFANAVHAVTDWAKSVRDSSLGAAVGIESAASRSEKALNKYREALRDLSPEDVAKKLSGGDSPVSISFDNKNLKEEGAALAAAVAERARISGSVEEARAILEELQNLKQGTVRKFSFDARNTVSLAGLAKGGPLGAGFVELNRSLFRLGKGTDADKGIKAAEEALKPLIKQLENEQKAADLVAKALDAIDYVKAADRAALLAEANQAVSLSLKDVYDSAQRVKQAQIDAVLAPDEQSLQKRKTAFDEEGQLRSASRAAVDAAIAERKAIKANTDARDKDLGLANKARLATQNAIKQQRKDQQAYADATDSLTGVVATNRRAVEDAEVAKAAAIRTTAKAIQDEADARVRLQDLYDQVPRQAEATRRAQEAITDAERERTRAVEDQVRAQNGLDDALESHRRAVEDTVRAQNALTDAEEAHRRAVADVRRSQYALTDAVTAHKRALEDQRFANEDAQKVLSGNDGTERATKATENLTQKTRDATKALLDLRSAQIEAEGGAISTAEAQKKLADAISAAGRGQGSQLDVQRARLDVDRAVQAARQAAFAQLPTLTDQTTTNETKTTGPTERERVAAQRSIEDAAKAVRDSALGIEDAQRGVTDANKAVRDTAISVTDAHRGVADAQKAVRDTALGVIDANRGLEDAQTRIRKATEGVKDAEWALVDARRAERDLGLSIRDQKDAIVTASLEVEAAKRNEVRAEVDLVKARRDLARSNEVLQDMRDQLVADSIAVAEAKKNESEVSQQLADLQLAENRARTDSITAAQNEKFAIETIQLARRRAVAEELAGLDKVTKARQALAEALFGQKTADFNKAVAEQTRKLLSDPAFLKLQKEIGPDGQKTTSAEDAQRLVQQGKTAAAALATVEAERLRKILAVNAKFDTPQLNKIFDRVFAGTDLNSRDEVGRKVQQVVDQLQKVNPDVNLGELIPGFGQGSKGIQTLIDFLQARQRLPRLALDLAQDRFGADAIKPTFDLTGLTDGLDQITKSLQASPIQIPANIVLTDRDRQALAPEDITQASKALSRLFAAGQAVGRYDGGPVRAGQPYVVGESIRGGKGELFVPGQNGTIFSNKAMRALERLADIPLAASSTTVNITTRATQRDSWLAEVGALIGSGRR